MHTTAKNMRWRTFNGEPIHLPIKQVVEDTIKRETVLGYKLMVCIGTDSQVKGKVTDFATVIVFLRGQHGGFMLINNFQQRIPMSLNERMLAEVAK